MFFRGSWNLDNLLIDALNFFNEIQIKSDDGDRHYIKYVFGSGNKLMNDNKNRSSVDSYDDDYGPRSRYCDFRHNRVLKWKRSDLGPMRYSEVAISYLSLSEEAVKLVDEVRKWKSSEDWYYAHGVPWKLGCLLHGTPGNGKTSLVRAISEDLDLPLFIYDLSSISNRELKEAWNKMLQSVPCMAVIEDIDNVFDRRDNIVRTHGGGLTFDCLVNCIDGVQRSNGLLLFITTNCIDKIDPALGTLNHGGSTRPGRIDRIVAMEAPSIDGKMHICSRIIADYPEIWDEILDAGINDSGAAFQDRCRQKALDLYWSKQ